MADYTTELFETEAIPAPDDLIAGSAFITVDTVTVTGAGEYKRGEILVKSGDEYVRCTPTALASAADVGICTQSFALEADSEVRVPCYMMGHFSMRRIVIGGELLSEYDAKEQISVQDSLRRHKIFLH